MTSDIPCRASTADYNVGHYPVRVKYMPIALRMHTKLTLIVSLLLTVLLAGGAAITVDRFEKALVAEIFRSQYAMLSSAAEELDTRMATAHLTLIAAAAAIPRDALNDADRLQTILDQRDDLHSIFDNHIFIFTPEGTMFTESPFAPNRRGKDFSYREYIKNTVAGGKPYISDPYITTQAHKHPVIMMTAPIFDADGKMRAILSASLDLMRDNFLGKLAQRKVGKSGYYYLTTGDRVMVMHPDKQRIFKPFPPGGNAAYDAAINGFQGTRETVNTYGKHMYATFKRLSQKTWVLAVNYPVDEALAPVADFQLTVLMFTLFGLIASALLIHWLMGRLLQPVQALTRHMSTLSGKSGAARVLPVSSEDEAGQLTRSFNDMVTTLDRQKQELADKEALYRTVVRFATDFIFWRSPDGQIRYVSENAEKVTGYPAAAFRTSPQLLDDIIHPEDRAAWQQHLLNVEATDDVEARDFRIVTRSGEVRWVSHLCQKVIDERGQVAGIRGSHSDVTARKHSESRLRLAGAVFDSAREAILVSNQNNEIVAVNPAFTEITGYSESEVIGLNPRLLKSGETPVENYTAMWRDLRLHGYWQGEFSNRRKDGSVYEVLAALSAVHDEQGRLTHYVGIESDISAMKAAEERIEHLAYHDALTGLPNRLLLLERADLALALAARRREMAAILFLDLDRFKDVNDSLGHAAGDALLIEAGKRLVGLTRETDTVSRLGGDEFVVLLPGADQNGAKEVSDKILQQMRMAFVVEGHNLTMSTSIGIALYPKDGSDIGELLKNADTALYRAKQEGRNTQAFYDREMNIATFEKLVLESELKAAIQNGDLVTYYQPKVRLEDERLIGAEALVRWRHPQHGLIPPGQFIPVAETSGLIDELCHWVLDDVFRQLAEWRREGLRQISVAVNLSPRNFRSAHLIPHLQSLLTTYALPADAIELELTESILLEAGEQVLSNLLAIKHLGIGLAIDDFGTGYSSLGYLRRLPISVLKIDQSFVRDLESDLDDRTLAGSIIALGHSLGLSVIAEGLETLAQRDILMELGCRTGQGYLYSRPISAEEFRTWVVAGGPPAPLASLQP
jgi:diguanylate cyclase (GGDEF)-like protein/PAS domain S-box-containing protein